MVRKIIKALWILLAVVLVAIVVIFVSISKGWIGYMPPVEELENPNYKFATVVRSHNSWQNSCLRKKWQAIPSSVCCKSLSNG